MTGRGRVRSWTAASKTPRGDRWERERGRIVTSRKWEREQFTIINLQFSMGSGDGGGGVNCERRNAEGGE